MAEQPRAGIIGSDFERLVTEYNKALASGEARPISAIQGDGAEASSCEQTFRKLLDDFPAPVYTTDAAGRITFYNEAAVQFAGRRAQLGTDQWCVTWRLYWPDGTPLPHDECPMAIALKEDRAVRGTQAVAERLDGTRVPFIPHPTPLRDASGALVGAVNMLLELKDVEQVALDGVQVLIVSDDIFVAAELDLLIDEAGGVAVAIAATASEALALLRERLIDAMLVSLPLRDGHGPSLTHLCDRIFPLCCTKATRSRLLGCSGMPSSFVAGVTKGGILEQLAQCPRQGPLASSKPEARIPCKGRADPRNLSLARDRSPQEEYHSWFRRKSGVGTGEWQVFVTRSCSEPLELLGERQLLIAGIFRLVFAQHMNQLDASRITRGMSH